MGKVEKAVIELNGEWGKEATERHVIVRAWRQDKGEFRYNFWYPNWEWRAEAETICTYSEFMETRKRLENKPEEWPEGADWLMQDSRGFWMFSEGAEPKPCAQTWHVDRAYGACARQGHVFGDWRQSLERRPQPDNKEGESVEWEFGVPPVGTWVEELMGGEHVEVICHGVGDKFCGRDKEGYIGIFDYTTDVIPIQSHRDKVIEAANEATNWIGTAPNFNRDVLGRLYDAGMLKLPGEEE